MNAQRIACLALALVPALAAGACDLSLTDPRHRITGDYDALWIWYVDVPSLGIADEGDCDGHLDITRQRGEDFSGRHAILSTFGDCIPERSGRIRGHVYSDGDLDLEIELRDGRFGVFEVEHGCRVIHRDRRLEGRFRHGRIDAFADAQFRCFLEGGERDVFVELDLLADERRRF
ncbi:MAG: hypothetical protein ABFS34_04690 [Gemmatimonadota bacterium]